MAINKLILKHRWKGKRLRIANVMSKENKVRKLILPNFKTYYKAIVITTMCYWHKNT